MTALFRSLPPALCVISLLVLSSATPVAAQQTREELVQQQRAEKARTLTPLQRGKIESGLFLVEDRFLMERIFNPPRGLFLRFGGLPEGSSMGAGPAYRIANQDYNFTASGVLSTRKSWDVDFRLNAPHLARGRAFAQGGFRIRDRPSEDYFGLGQSTIEAARATYDIHERLLDVSAGFFPIKWVTLTGSAEYSTIDLGAGDDPRYPSIEETFDETTAPGLGTSTDFIRVGGRLGFDYTERPLGTMVGGRYAVSFDTFSDRNLGRYSFDRWNTEFQQFVPVFTSARLLVFRAQTQSVSPHEGNVVPFHLQPPLGGSHSVRSLRVYRLRDANALLLQAEYRWEVNAFLAGSLFYDTGKVAERFRDLDLDGMSHSWGFGLRLGFFGSAAIRTEVVFGGTDGLVFAFRFGDVF